MSKKLAVFVDRKGVTALEYGLIAAFIAVIIITALHTIGTGLITPFATIAKSI